MTGTLRRIMVNSLERLFAEIIDTLDRAGQSVTDPYARSQVLAVIDILTNLAHRVEWKRADLQVTIDELQALFGEVAALLQQQEKRPAALTSLQQQLTTASTSSLSDDLVAERDRFSRLLITTMQEIAAVRAELPPAVADAIDRQCNTYLRRQLDRDIAQVRRPLFRRMSQG